MVVQPASVAARTAERAWAWTQTRLPSFFASSQAALIWASLKVCPPPSRTLLEAKILIRSAPSATDLRTNCRTWSVVSFVSIS